MPYGQDHKLSSSGDGLGKTSTIGFTLALKESSLSASFISHLLCEKIFRLKLREQETRNTQHQAHF